MKIAYLSTFYPYKGGIAQFNGSLLTALAKQNEVKAFNYIKQYPKLLFPGKSQYVNKDDKAIQIDSVRLLSSVSPISWKSTYNEISKFKPDLVLSKLWIPFLAPSVGYVTGKLRKDGTKAISVLGNVIPHEHRIGDATLTKYYLNRNDGFVAMAESVKNDLLKLKPDAKYIMGYHPPYDHFGEKIDKSQARAKLGIAPDKKVLIFFGFIRDYKGLDVLIDAFCKLDDSYHLIIAGESYSGFDSYDEQLKGSDPKRVTKLIKYTTEDEVALCFSASDLCVLPYRTATQSGIVGISYHFGVPVLVSDVGGLREMVEPWNAGTVLQKADSDLFRKAIEQHFATRFDYSEHIQKAIKDQSWESLSAKIIEFAKTI
jgi:glycosyltransferase involved in cell wall biosynthesis